MNALTPQPQNGQAAKTTSLEVSPALKPLLMSEGSSLAAVEQITQNPGLHAEAAALVPQLEAMIQPSSSSAVMAILGKAFAVYPQPDRSEAEWAAWWSAYIEDLEEFPAASLEAAMRDYRRQGVSEFFPKPGQLRALAEAHRGPFIGALARARMASRQPIRPVIVKPDAEARKAQVAEVMASLTEPKDRA